MERGRKELEELLETGGTRAEQDLLVQFSQGFAEFQRIDKDLLDLAVRNTNLKAFSLAFGPAADVLNEMDAALSRIVARSTESASQLLRPEVMADEARRKVLLEEIIMQAKQLDALTAELPNILDELKQS